jgi:glucose-1-phosphate thymidylyltransferase
VKGILLAGGANTRLLPLTSVISKQLLPVYDKPMVYYPLSVLMLAGLRQILIISTPRDIDRFELLLGDGSSLGLELSYASQPRPSGIAQAFLIGETFLAGSSCALALGDNILFGHGLTEELRSAAADPGGATIFGYEVKDPTRYGVVTLDAETKPVSIDEKPVDPRSHWAVIGLYFYDGDVVNVARHLAPSGRGELEITDVNRWYLERRRLSVRRLGRGFTWLDAGTFDSLHEASSFVQTIQARQGYRVACIEEIAFRQGYITTEQLQSHADRLAGTDYGRYLGRLAGS